MGREEGEGGARVSSGRADGGAAARLSLLSTCCSLTAAPSCRRKREGEEGDAREDNGRDVLVRELVALDAAVDAVGEATAGCDGDRREERLAGDVADRKDVLDLGGLVLVDVDVAVLLELEADRLGADVVGERVTADGPQEDVGLDLLALLGVDRLGERLVEVRVLDVGRHLLDVRVGVDVDARLDDVLLEHVLQHRVERLEDLLVADDEVRLDAERVQDAGELDGDVARTDDDGALGELLEVEEAVRVEAVLVAGDVLGQGRRAADGDDEAVGRVGALDVGTAVRLALRVRRDDGDLALAGELGVARDVLDLVLLDVCGRGRERPSALALAAAAHDRE